MKRITMTVQDHGFYLHILAAAKQEYKERLTEMGKTLGWYVGAEGKDLNDGERCFLAYFPYLPMTLTEYMRVYRKILNLCGTVGHAVKVTGTYTLVSEAFDDCTEGRVETDFEKHF